jgi:hypothetical protein
VNFAYFDTSLLACSAAVTSSAAHLDGSSLLPIVQIRTKTKKHTGFSGVMRSLGGEGLDSKMDFIVGQDSRSK